MGSPKNTVLQLSICNQCLAHKHAILGYFVPQYNGDERGEHLMIIIKQTYQHQWFWWACNRRVCFVTILVITAKCTNQKWEKEPKKSLGMSLQTIKNTDTYFPSFSVWHWIKYRTFDAFRYPDHQNDLVYAKKYLKIPLSVLLYSSLCRKGAAMNRY